MQCGTYSENPYVWGDGSEYTGYHVTSLAFLTPSGDGVDSEVPVEIEFEAPGSAPSKTINVTDYRDNSTGMTYHRVDVTSSNSAVILELTLSSATSLYEIYFRKLYTPTSEEYDYKTAAGQIGNTLTVTIPSQYVPHTGTYYLGLDPVGKYYVSVVV